jgi:hypothetical protein
MVVTMHRPVSNVASATLAEEVSEAHVRRDAAETARKSLFKACQSTLVSALYPSRQHKRRSAEGGQWSMHIFRRPLFHSECS